MAGALGLAGTLAAAPPPAAHPAPASFTGSLGSVSAVSATDAWAAGNAGSAPVLLHWNGTNWAQAAIPRPAGGSSLSSVSADSASDAWAVGSYSTPQSASLKTMALHWNGTAWTKVTTPSPGPGGSSLLLDQLTGVSADSSTDAWAVGAYGTTGSTVPLVLHWNGTAWKKAAFPAPAGSSLLAVSALSPRDVWAVGYDFPGNSPYQTLVMHWNGTTWSQVPSPSPGFNLATLTSVSAQSPTDVWAAGDYATATTGNYRTMILHWNGAIWTQATTPSPAGTGKNAFSDLNGISADSPTDAWAAGSYGHTTAQGLTQAPLLLHWNGTTWTQTTAPPTGTNATLGAVDALSPTSAVAVGGHFSRTSGGNTIEMHWNGTTWTQP